MRLFYQAFPNCDALRHELSWTHYRMLLGVDNPRAREWYMQEAATQQWSSRALERQIHTLYYKRLLSSHDRLAVEQEATDKLAKLSLFTRDFVHDPVILEFWGLPESGRLLEADLESGLINKLQTFLMGLGKGFAMPQT
jgi:predicted nuclease of restriction endonuclease-like (RecB) superfamily